MRWVSGYRAVNVIQAYAIGIIVEGVLSSVKIIVSYGRPDRGVGQALQFGHGRLSQSP